MRADTGIDAILIDRVCDAFDALIDHQDVEGYKRHMMTAYAQQGLQPPIPDSERPTAMDKVKTICIKAYSDRRRISYQAAIRELRRMQQA